MKILVRDFRDLEFRNKLLRNTYLLSHYPQPFRPCNYLENIVLFCLLWVYPIISRLLLLCFPCLPALPSCVVSGKKLFAGGLPNDLSRNRLGQSLEHGFSHFLASTSHWPPRAFRLIFDLFAFNVECFAILNSCPRLGREAACPTSYRVGGQLATLFNKEALRRCQRSGAMTLRT